MIITLLLCLISIHSEAQKQHDILLSFVKTNSIQSSDSLYFNVLKLENISEHALLVSLKISVPEVLTLMSKIPAEIILFPGKIKHIPFRISISKTASSNQEYNLQAQLLSENRQSIVQTACKIKIRPHREWNIIIDDSELIFSGEKNTIAQFNFRLVNLGNTNEKISINLDIPEGFKPAGSNRRKNFNIKLLPGKDSLISYKVIQKQKNKELNFSDDIILRTYNDHNHYKERIKISSYSNYFDFLPLKKNELSYIEYSRKMTNGIQDIKHELKLKGIIPLKSDNKLIYSFTNYDLTNTEEFWERSYYQLVFEGKNFSGGIGQHYSNLLLDGYNPHGAFVKYKVAASKKSEIELYASQGLDYNITSVAAGHELTIDKLIIKTSLGYNEDGKRKQKSKSGIFSAKIPLSINHEINLNARGIERETYNDSLYIQRAMQGNWSYLGKMSPRLFLNFKNRFRTKGFYFGNQSDNKMTAAINFKVNRKSRWMIEYSYNTKTGGSNNYDITDHLLKTTYEFKTHKNRNIKTGIWLEEYSNQETTNFNIVRSCNLWVETSSRKGGLTYDFSAMAGYRFQENSLVENGNELFDEDSAFNLLVEGKATLAPFSMRCSYIDGSQKSSGLSQRSNYNELRISPSFRQDLFRDKMLVELQADYDVDWVSKRKSFNIRPRVSVLLNKDWSIIMDGYISAYGEQSQSLIGDDFNSNFRISLRKNFSIGKRHKKEKYHKMEMVFYRDENKNGLKDKNEKGIEKNLVSIDKRRDQKDEKYVSLSNLVSQNDGKISYENIPEGYYDLDVNQLASTDGYFNFEGSKLNIKLDKDTTCYIPYIKAYKIEGELVLKKSRISSKKVGQVSKIKVTATDSQGKSFSCLTSRSGYYQLPVAGKDTYVVSIHNPYGRRIKVKNNNTSVDFSENEVEEVNFEFVEKRRQVNMKKAKSSSNRKKNSLSRLPKANKKTDKNKAVKVDEETKLVKPAVVKKSAVVEKTIHAKDSLTNIDYWIYTKPIKDENKKEQYWVVGGFRNEENAVKRKDILVNIGVDTSIIYNEEYGLYYVFIKKVISPMD